MTQPSYSAIAELIAVGWTAASAGVAIDLCRRREVSSSTHRSGMTTTTAPSTELIKALQEDDDQDIETLRSKTVLQDIIFKDFDNGKILHVAVKQGAKKCLRLLLSYEEIKAHIEIPDDNGRTPLLVAVVNAQSKALEMLLNAKANVNARDNNHYGVLHLLLLELSKDKMKEEQKRLMEVANLLLPVDDKTDHHPPLDKLDLEPHANLYCWRDATPLSATSSMLQHNKNAKWIPNIREFCKKLIIAGAYYSEEDKDIIEKGINLNKLETEFDMQNPLPRKIDLKLIDEVCRGQVNLVKKLISQLEDAQRVCAINSWVGQHSLLYWAVERNNFEMVDVLLEFGANPRVGDKLPIEEAAERGFLCIFELLLKKMKPLSQDEKDHLNKILENRKTDCHEKCQELIQDL